MLPFLITALATFVFYLLLVVGSGDIIFWSFEEIIAGIIIGIITGLISHKIFCKNNNLRMLNPIRLLTIIVYLGPFFVELTHANLDVAYRVITGRIRPGIVKVHSGLKSDLAITMLAHSITLTPGTLSVEVDENNDLYVHMINVPPEIERKAVIEPEEIFSYFNLAEWIRRIAE